MNKQSISTNIYERMKQSPENTIFIPADFIDLADHNAIRVSLHRLEEKNLIIRLLNGFYTIPQYLSSINEIHKPSHQDLATKIADKFGWNIIPYGDTALNYVGLSTQVPNQIGFLSTGPYREYEYQNKIIMFKHTNKLLKSSSYEISLVIQAIKAIGKHNLNEDNIQRLVRYFQYYVPKETYDDIKYAPEWIYKELKAITVKSK